jgi:hypothetical protein
MVTAQDVNCYCDGSLQSFMLLVAQMSDILYVVKFFQTFGQTCSLSLWVTELWSDGCW